MQIELPQEIRPYSTSTQTMSVMKATPESWRGTQVLRLHLTRLSDGMTFEGVAFGGLHSHPAEKVRRDLAAAAADGTAVVMACKGLDAEDQGQASAQIQVVDYRMPCADEQLVTCESCAENLPAVRRAADPYVEDVCGRTESADFCVGCYYKRAMDV